ncbi:MAG TPA: hypothetical protein VIM62_03990 [Acidobacteriaceae bacterium]
MHSPFKNACGKLYDVTDDGDHIKIVRERTDLDVDVSQRDGILK